MDPALVPDFEGRYLENEKRFFKNNLEFGPQNKVSIIRNQLVKTLQLTFKEKFLRFGDWSSFQFTFTKFTLSYNFALIDWHSLRYPWQISSWPPSADFFKHCNVLSFSNFLITARSVPTASAYQASFWFTWVANYVISDYSYFPPQASRP